MKGVVDDEGGEKGLFGRLNQKLRMTQYPRRGGAAARLN